jgi:transposase, IS5 family
MRRQDQLELVRLPAPHAHAAELEQISRLLEENPRMAARVTQDLLRGLKKPETGARGLSGDQVLRILLIKQMKGFSYEALAFHLGDSLTYRAFCRLGAFAATPSPSTLAENIGKIRPETLEKLNRRLVRHAVKLGIEAGRRVRIDATAVQTNVHAPRDSKLLSDGVRVLARQLAAVQEAGGFTAWSDHTKRAKRRAYAIQFGKSASRRTALYRDLLKVTRRSVGYAERAVEALRGTPHAALGSELEETTHLVWMAIDQTERRVLRGEQVPAEEKLLSLFEPHTDLIVKISGTRATDTSSISAPGSRD